MSDPSKKMCDPIKSPEKPLFSELDGAENRATALYPALGADVGGSAINVFDGADGALRNSFVVTYFLEAVYRVTPDGQATVIFRAAEPKG